MGNKTLVVDITANASKFVKGFEDSIRQIESVAKKADLLGSMQSEIETLKQSYKSVQGEIGKFSPTMGTQGFDAIIQKMREVETQTTSLETKMAEITSSSAFKDTQGLDKYIATTRTQIQTLKGEAKEFANYMQEILATGLGTNGTTNGITQETQNAINQIKQYEKAIADLKKSQVKLSDEDPKPMGKDMDEMLKNIDVAIQKYNELQQKIQSGQFKGLDLSMMKAQLGEVSQMLIATQGEVESLALEITQGEQRMSFSGQEFSQFLDPAQLQKNLNEARNIVKTSIGSIQNDINSIKTKYNITDEMLAGTQTTTKSAVTNLQLKEGKIFVPIEVDNAGLTKQVQSTITAIQNSIKPITVPIKLISSHRSATHKEINDNVQSSFNEEISKTTEENINKQALKEVKFDININRKQAESDFTSLMSELTKIADNGASQISNSFNNIFGDKVIDTWSQKFISAIDLVESKINQGFNINQKNDLYTTLRGWSDADSIMKTTRIGDYFTGYQGDKSSFSFVKQENVMQAVVKALSERIDEKEFKKTVEGSNAINGLKKFPSLIKYLYKDARDAMGEVERFALYDSSSQQIKGTSYGLGHKGVVPDKIIGELRSRLELGNELYDTFIHSHPTETRDYLGRTIERGAHLSFSDNEGDLGWYYNQLIDKNSPIKKMLLESGGKYNYLDLSSLDSKQVKKIIDSYSTGIKEETEKRSDEWTQKIKDNTGKFSHNLIDNDVFSQIRNDVLSKTIKDVTGLSDISHMFRQGSIEDLKMDTSSLTKSEQEASKFAAILEQMSASLSKISSQKFKIDTSSLETVTEQLQILLTLIDSINTTLWSIDFSKMPQGITASMGNLTPFFEQLSQIGGTNIEKGLQNFSEKFSMYTGVYTEKDINAQFKKMQDSYNAMTKTKDGSVNINKNRKALQGLVSDYQKYVDMGGKDPITAITDNEKGQAKLQKFYQKIIGKQQPETTSVTSAQNIEKENQALERTSEAAQKAAQSKTAFATANQTVAATAEQSSTAINAENEAMNKTGQVINKSGQATKKADQKTDKSEKKVTPPIVTTNKTADSQENNSMAEERVEKAEEEQKIIMQTGKTVEKMNESAEQSTQKRIGMMEEEAKETQETWRGTVDSDALSKVYEQAKREYQSGAKTWNEARDGLNEAFKQFYSKEGYEYASANVKLTPNFDFISGAVKTYNDELKQTVIDSYKFNKNTGGIIRSGISMQDNGLQREKAIKSEYQKIETARANLEKYLADFNSKTVGRMQDNQHFQELSNFKIGNLDDIETARNLMLKLDADYSRIVANMRRGGSSLNPFVNMDTQIGTAAQSVDNVALSYDKLFTKSDELEGKIKELAEAFITLQSAPTLEKQAEAFGIFKTKLNEVRGDMKLLRQVDAQIGGNKLQGFATTFQNLDPSGEGKIDKYITEYNALGQKIQEVQSLASQAYSAKGTPAYMDYVNQIKAMVPEIQQSIKTLTSDSMNIFQQGGKTVIAQNIGDIEQARAEVEKFGQSYQQVIRSTESTNLSNGMTTFTMKVKDAQGVVQDLVFTFDSATNTITRGIKAQSAAMSTSAKFIGEMGAKFKSVFKYFASFGSIYRIWGAFKNGLGIIKELDVGLTEMQKVSDESLTTLQAYQKEAFKIASDIGSSGSQIQQSTADWLRLGENLSEAKQSAKASNILFNVSEFQSIDEATTSLVSASSAYSNLDKMDIVDKLNNIGNNFSISTDGIATALQNSASALTTANNDIDEAIALITAGNAITQDPHKVGAGIRTIALRIQGTEQAKEELKSLGEDTEDYIVGTKSKINEQVKAFTAVASNEFKGVSLLDENGNYRSTYEILQDIADIYDEIQETDKKYGTNHEQGLLELLAGKTRANIAASILQNADMLRDVYETSQNSEGSALEENQKYLDSISGHLDQIKNKWQELWAGSASRDGINMFIDLGKAILTVANNIGGLQSLTGIIGGVYGFTQSLQGKGMFNVATTGQGSKMQLNSGQSFLGTLFAGNLQSTRQQAQSQFDALLAAQDQNPGKSAKDVAAAIGITDKTVLHYANSCGEAQASQDGFEVAMQSLTLKTKALSIATTALNTVISMGTALLVSFGISMAMKGIDYLLHREEEIIKKGEEAQSVIESSSKSFGDVNTTISNLGKTYNESTKEISTSEEAIDSLTKKYYELKKGVNAATNENVSLSDTDYQSYLDISNQLANTFPSIKSGTDEAGNAILNMGNNAGEASSQLKELLDAERAIAHADIVDNLVTSFKGAKNEYASHERQKTANKGQIKQSQDKKSERIAYEGTQTISQEYYAAIKKAAIKNKVPASFFTDASNQSGYNGYMGYGVGIDTKNAINFDKLKEEYFANESDWQQFVNQMDGAIEKTNKEFRDNIDKLSKDNESLEAKEKNLWMTQLENVKSYLQTDPTFLEADTNLTQSIIDNLKNNSKFTKTILDTVPEEEFEDYIYDNILTPLSFLEQPAQEKLANALSLDTNTLSYAGYKSQVNNILKEVFPEDKASQKEWKNRLGLDKMLDTYKQNFKLASDHVTGLKEELKNLSGEDLQLVAKMDADESIDTLGELKTKIQELRKEAEEPVPVTIEEAIKEEDSTFTAAQKAQESANSGATYDTMFSMYKTAKELVEKGDIGTDDFQKIAAMFSPSGAKDLENWNENLGKIKSYFTEDNSGLKNFLNDLKDKGLADFDEKLKSWTLNLGDMEKAARKMGIGYEPFLAILGELKDKGFTNDFFADAESGGQLLGDLTNQLYEAQKELDDLNTYDRNNKTAIKAKEEEIESLQERIESTTESLDELLNPKNVEELPKEINGARDRMQKRLSAFNKTSKQYTDGEGKQAMKTYGEAVVQALQKEGFVNAGLREGKNGAWKIDLDVNTDKFETKSRYKDVEKGGERDRKYYNKNKDAMTEDERETYKRDWINKRQEGKGNKKKYKNAGENIEGNLVNNVVESNRDIVDTYVDLYKSGKDYSGQQEKLKKIADEQGKSINDLIRDYGSAGKLEEYQQAYLNDPETQQLSEGPQYDTSTIEGATNSNTDAVNANTAALEANTKEKENDNGKGKERDSNRRLPEDDFNKPSNKEQRVREEKKKQNKETAEGHDKPSSKEEKRTRARKKYEQKEKRKHMEREKTLEEGGKRRTSNNNRKDSVTGELKPMNQTNPKWVKNVDDILKTILPITVSDFFPTVHANAAEVDAEHNYDNYQTPLDESINAYCEELDRAKEANVDFSKTVYGNIDTDTRQKLYWTDENRERYASAARSWGMDTSTFKDYSTVEGMWGNFGENGSIPIAFTPMLQTESGTPELLDQDTVNNYIEEIISQATEDGQVNPLKLFDLDAEGMDIDGQHISNLIAGIGDEADLISQQMHYSGETGSLFGIAQGIQEELDASGMSINDFLAEYGDKIPDELKKALTEAKVGEVGKDGFEVEMDVDQKKVEKKLKKLKKGQSLEFTADVEGIEQEVEAVTDEEGNIHYYTNINEVETEVEPVVNEDGSVTYKPITDNLPEEKDLDDLHQKVIQEAEPDDAIISNPAPLTQTVNQNVNSNMPESTSTNVSVTTSGAGSLASLQNAINSVKGKTETVEAKAKGEPKVRTLASAINGVRSKAVSVVASLSGTTASVFDNLASSISKLKSKTINIVTNYKKNRNSNKGGNNPPLFGTARTSGTAFAKGTLSNEQTDNIVRSNSWKTSKPMDALTGEVGQELVVTGNKWFTVGDNGAEFAHIPKGAVVFNAEQTEQLFSKGYISSRGKVNGQLRYPSSSAHFLDGSIDDDLDALDEVDSLDAFLTGNAFYNRATGPDLGGGGGGTTKKKDTSSKKTTSKGKGKGKKGKGKSKGKSKKDKKWDAFEKWLDSLFDWMEIRLDRLSRKTEQWQDAAENAVTLSSEGGTWGEGGAKTTRKLGTKKNPINYTTDSMDSTTNKAIQATRKEYRANSKAEDLYEKRAQKIRDKAVQKLSKKKQKQSVKKAYKALKSGKRVDITKYGEKTRTVIEEMQNWLEKSLDAEAKTTELQQQLADLYRQRFDNIQDWYEMVRGLYSDKAATEESFINARVASGEKIYRGDYQNQLDNLETARKKSIAEYNALYKEFSAQVKAGRVVEGTSVWYEMRDELEKAEAQVYDDTEALASLNDEIDQLELEHLQDVIDRISSVIDRLSEMGDVIQDIGDTTWNTALPNLKTLYKNEAVRTGQEYTALNNRRNEIISQMENKEVGSEQWNKLKEELDSTDSSLISIIKNLTEINEKNRELNWKPFEDGMEDLEHYRDELSTIQDFLNEDNLVGKNGLLTTEGWANIALMAKQMELSEDAIYNNRKALEKLKEEHENEVISQDKLTEESRKYCDAIADEARNLEDYKSKVLDAYLDSLEKQNDLLQENIDKRKDALSKVKDYYDYQRTISEKSKDINYLQQQIAALDGVSNKAAQAKLASLRDELAEAQLDMNDTVYDHEYELRTEGLDSLSEDVQTAFDNMTERLQRNHNERDKLLSELLTPVGNKSTEIATLLQGVIDANGLIVEITDKDKNSLKADLISAESIKALDEFSDSILNFKDFNASTELTKVAEQLTAISNLDTTSVYSNLKNFKEIYNKIVEIGTANTIYEDKGKTPNGNSSTVPNVGKGDPKPNSSSSSNNAKTANKTTKTTSYTEEQKANYKTRIDGYLVRNGKKYNKTTKYGELNTALGKKTGFVLDEKHRKDLAKHLGTTEKELYKFLQDIGYLPSLKLVNTKKTTVSGKFAKGTKKVPKDMLGITQDAGQEVIFRKSDGAMLTPLGKGDKVFTAQMTDNLWKLAQSASVSNGLSELSAPIINNVSTNSPTININFENFMTVQGNVDKEAITDIKKFKSEMVDEFTRTMTNEMNLLGHKFRF